MDERNKESSLKKIANVVISPIDETATEIYLATDDGEYGMLRIGVNQTDFRFNELTSSEYLKQTQHLLKDPQFKTLSGSR